MSGDIEIISELMGLLEGIVEMGEERDAYVGGDLREAFEQVAMAAMWWVRFVEGEGDMGLCVSMGG